MDAVVIKKCPKCKSNCLKIKNGTFYCINCDKYIQEAAAKILSVCASPALRTKRKVIPDSYFFEGINCGK